MRGFVASCSLLILLLPSVSNAGCSDTFSGESKKLQITISDCDHRDMMILISNFSPTTQGGVPREPISFATQCKMSSTGFSCHSKGKTPLAGSAYRYTQDTNPSCEGERAGVRLTCIKGCNTNIPKYFYIRPWEC